jgi:hypothetical protein
MQSQHSYRGNAYHARVGDIFYALEFSSPHAAECGSIVDWLERKAFIIKYHTSKRRSPSWTDQNEIIAVSAAQEGVMQSQRSHGGIAYHARDGDIFYGLKFSSPYAAECGNVVDWQERKAFIIKHHTSKRRFPSWVEPSETVGSKLVQSVSEPETALAEAQNARAGA